VNRFRLGEGLARSLAWGLAAMAICCGQVSERGKPQDTASEAGQGSSSASGGSGMALGGTSASGGSANLAGTGASGGSGMALGGGPIEGDQGGSTSVAGAGPAAVPLLDTMLCGHDFVRVDQLPEVAPFFSGTFDGEPVEVFESAEASEPPTFYVFRFGASHVEAISFHVHLPEGPYDGIFQVGAADCGTYSNLRREAGSLHYYELESAALDTVTHSVDGFSGLTTGSVSASWIDDDGEQHALEADFAMNAVMGDARAER
jgi:hypothetical protein